MLENSRRSFLLACGSLIGGSRATAETLAASPLLSGAAPSTPPIPAQAKPVLGLSSQLIHSTCMVRGSTVSGTQSSGTSFLFDFFRSGSQSFPALVTNKHVVASMAKGYLVFTLAKPDDTPDLGALHTVELDNFEQRWIGHPDPTIDLAIIPIGAILTEMQSQGKKAFIIALSQDIVPTNEQKKSLTPLENIIVIGYPDGISDAKNNLPVIRKGITATPVNVDFDGTPNFLIDASIFPGSSGSPAFILDQGSFSGPEGGLVIGSRLMLVGVVHQVAQHTTTGVIKLVPAPTQATPMSITLIPNNLGVCIDSSKILDFEPFLVRQGLPLPPGYNMRAASQ